jgi:hypothetical protein
MLAKINKLLSWQAALIIIIVGFIVYSDGLKNQFLGDDSLQIVYNVPVHSISNIKLLFEGGTFYNGQGLSPLTGTYYRPLMSIVFSLIYTIFGPHPFYFHLVQLVIYLGSSVILFLFLRYTFKPVVALSLSLVFLVHPINSEVVFAIATMQDALYFFFGILALYLLVRFKTILWLTPVCLCLFLSLLSKESEVAFVFISLVYLFWWDRKRVLPFIGMLVPPIALYMSLRIHAIGLLPPSNNAFIDYLPLSGRLMTDPSILLFYISKFVFPWKLASQYYWVHSSFSIRYVLVPLVIDLIVLGAFVCLGYQVQRRCSKAMVYTYLFFAAWTVIGLILILQISPLDMTVSETWFYFPEVGVLGMLGIVSTLFPVRPKYEWIFIAAIVVLISGLGIRTALRALDWRSYYSISVRDAANAPNYRTYDELTVVLIEQGHYQMALTDAKHAVALYPSFSDYTDLAFAYGALRNYPSAYTSYLKALHQHGWYIDYESLAELLLVYGNQKSNFNFFSHGLSVYPHDSKLWFYEALLEQKYGDNAKARSDIQQAARYGPISQQIYLAIINNQKISINLQLYRTSVTI